MTLKQLKSLIKQGESEVLEFKSSIANLSASFETVCAFLNSDHGGIVLIGVKDNGAIVGQEIIDKHTQAFAIEIKRIEPFTKINIKYVPIDNKKKVVVFSIDPGQKAPYTYDGRPFIRTQSTTSRMTQEEYEYFYHKKNQQRWEGLTNNSCKLIDLDKIRIKEVVRMGIFAKRLPVSTASETISDTLTKMKLIVNGKITNAAIVLFCKKDQVQFIQSVIQLARFKGIDKKTFLDTKEARGNAFDLHDKAMDFLHFNLPVGAEIVSGKAQRVETPAIPYSALREAVTNALIHRDYSNAGGSVSIAVYNDRVNITNIGSLPKGVALKQLPKEHPSILRNPLIANVFYLCGNIEKWGRGTIDMVQDCKEAGNPIPKYEEIGGSFSVTLPFRELIHNIVPEKIKHKITPKLTDRQRKILDVLKSGPLSRQQIMTNIKEKLAERTIRLELVKLKKLGLIISAGKTKSVVWSLVFNSAIIRQ